MSRASAVGVAAAVLVAAAAVVYRAAAQDGRRPPVAPRAGAVRWIDGWERGRQVAAERGTPILVYVHQSAPRNEACERLDETVFASPAGEELSRRFVAVRLTAGDAETRETAAFFERYGRSLPPVLSVLNAEGHMLVPAAGATVEALLRSLERGARLDAEFHALDGATEPEARLRRATLLIDRMAWDEARSALDALLAEAPSAAAHEAQVDLLRRTGKADEELALLRQMLELYPRADHAPAWRVRLALQPTERVASRAEFLARLGAARTALAESLAAAEAAADLPAQAQYHVALADIAGRLGDSAAAATHADWVLDHAAHTPFAASALTVKGHDAFRRGAWADSRALFERVLAEFPDSPEARDAPRAIENCNARLGTRR